MNIFLLSYASEGQGIFSTYIRYALGFYEYIFVGRPCLGGALSVYPLPTGRDRC